jgi:hypothetical protein
MNTTLEDRVRDVLVRQAASLQPPDIHPDDAVVVVSDELSSRRGRSRRRLLVAAAAAILMTAGAVALVNHRGDRPAAGDESPGSAAFTFKTSTVQLEAASVVVETAGRSFAPPADVAVHSDPGTPNDYTTLELEWTDNGTPMRINMYFTSDATDWWANELRTYDGSASGEWIEMQGEYFRSQLGTAFHGDLDAGPLHIRGMTLTVFPEPAACGTTDKLMALSPTETAIDVPGSPVSGYATSVYLLDTATCQPVDVSTVRVDVTVDDPTIVELVDDGDLGLPTGVIRVNMHSLQSGPTKVHVKISDPATGVLIDEAVIGVTVAPS